MKFILICMIGIGLYSSIYGQSRIADTTNLRRISDYILETQTCYDDLRYLCKNIGHRLSGSEQADRAVEWAKQTLKQAGCDKVYLQPVSVPNWKRGETDFFIETKEHNKLKINALTLGNSVGTNGVLLSAPVIIVDDLDELKSLGYENVKGKIVFFNYKWNQKKCNPFHEYGHAVYYRWAGPSEAAKLGAKAVVIRSAGAGKDKYPHTGSMHYDTNYVKIPAMAISYTDADMLSNLVKNNEVLSLNMMSTCHFEPNKLSYNVIGEITGNEVPGEYIIVGGHLDSWDIGEGAHDDGAGCVQSIEVIRSFKKLNITPRRTIRCVLFMNEENGLAGGTEYALQVKMKNENHIVAIETDAGGFSPRGFSMKGNREFKTKIKGWAKYFDPIGVYDFEQDGGGADIGPLNKEMGTPLMELLPDPQRYFDLHHTENDVFEQVHNRELSMGAISLAYMCYLISEYGL